MKSVQTWDDRNHTKRASDPPSMCPICNGGFRQKSPAGRPQVYCSRQCARIHAVNVRELHKTVEKVCKICSKTYFTSKWKATDSKYCSIPCKVEGRKVAGTREFPCAACGKPVRRRPKEFRRTITCSIACREQAKILEFPRTPHVLSVRKWFSRFNRMSECEKCGYKEIVGILILHHRDRNRKNNTRENLAVLCPNCHAAEHLEENKKGWRHKSTDHVAKKRYRDKQRSN